VGEFFVKNAGGRDGGHGGRVLVLERVGDAMEQVEDPRVWDCRGQLGR
jgi:hypothetical protein